MYTEIEKYDKFKLGIFYTHNKIDENLLNLVITYLNKISQDRSILFIASSYIPLKNFNGINLISRIKTPCHLCICIQILQCLVYAKKLNPNFKFVSFLEHDILYPVDYFDYAEFEENIMVNSKYIQLSSRGFEKSNGGNPLSQLIMRFDFSINHFHEKIIKVLEGDLKLEPKNKKYSSRISTPTLHFKHKSYTTNHFDTFDKKYYQIDDIWGNSSDMISRLTPSIV